LKEFFDQLRAEAERLDLPQPAELRERSDRRAAGRGAAAAFSLAVVIAGGFVAAKPLFHEHPPINADRPVTSSPATTAPETRPVPDVIGLSRIEAMSVLTNQGFKVQVMTASPVSSGDPQAGKVRLQDPVAALRMPSQTTVTIWVDPPQESVPVCADTFPKRLPTTLFVKTEVEICFAPGETPTNTESLPAPCVPTVLASDALIEDRRGFIATLSEQVSGDPAPTMAHQTITKYKGTGAKDYMSQLTKEIGRCLPITRGSLRLTYLLEPVPQETIGDQSLLISVEYRLLDKPESGPPASTYLVSVVRVGMHVIVIYDKGWEGMPSKRVSILDLAREIARRIT